MGFEYVKGQGCQDTDECKNTDPWATCGYGDCINTIGSYACKCKPGYVYKGMALKTHSDWEKIESYYLSN